jgi:hypothetical protein
MRLWMNLELHVENTATLAEYYLLGNNGPAPAHCNLLEISTFILFLFLNLMSITPE